MYCPKCGRQIPDGAKFCSQCGAIVNQDKPKVDSVVMKDVKKRFKRKKTVFLFSGIAIFFCALVIAGLNYMGDMEKVTLYAMPENGKWGYVDENNKYIIKPEYDSALNFSECGLACVAKRDGSGSYKYGCIDRKGEMIIPIEYEYIDTFINVGDGGYIAKARIGEKCTYLDNTGTKITEKLYSSDSAEFEKDRCLVYYDDDADGIGLYGVIDKSGKEIIECRYVDLERSSINSGLLRAAIEDEFGDWKEGYIDENGNTVIEFKYEYADGFGENEIAPVAIEDDHKKLKYGFINKEGKTIIDYRYDDAGSFHGRSLAPVAKYDDDGNMKYGFIDQAGRTVIDFKYDMAESFNEQGIAVVGISVGDDDWKMGCIDEQGEVVINLEYDGIQIYDNGFIGLVTDGESGACCYANPEGKLISEAEYWDYESKAVHVENTEKDLLKVARIVDNDKAEKDDYNYIPGNYNWGYLNALGEEIIPCEYFWINFQEGVFYVAEKDGNKIRIGYRDRQGDWIIKPEDKNWYQY